MNLGGAVWVGERALWGMELHHWIHSKGAWQRTWVVSNLHSFPFGSYGAHPTQQSGQEKERRVQQIDKNLFFKAMLV